MLRELGECIVYISENWVSQKSENVREVQVRLSKIIGFIIYFLHREIRVREDEEKEFLKGTLNDIMAAIFVIVLKKYPKDHEHAPTDTQAAKVISIVLNCFFEKSDKTLLFTRKDIENHQAKDYQSIASFLTTDLCHEFFEESKHFRMMKKEFYKDSYIDIVSRERYYYAKKVKVDQDTRDYQEKKKYQEISTDINDKHNSSKMKDEYIKKETLMWIDQTQRTVKRSLRRMYNNLFSWRGVWRNKEMFDFNPENVPVKIFNFVTKSLSKPILKNMVTHGL